MSSQLASYNNALLQLSCSAAIDMGDLAQACQELLTCALNNLDIGRCSLWLYNEKQTLIECYMLALPNDIISQEPLCLSQEDYPNYFRHLEQERALIAHDAQQDEATREFTEGYLKPLHITSLLDIPVRHKGKMIGIICCENTAKMRHWHDTDITFAGCLADIAGRAISAQHRAAAEQALQANNRQLEILLRERNQYLESIEDQLLESERMVSLGNLVSGVAHEVNTPIGVSVTATSHLDLELKKIHKRFSDGEITKSQLEDFLNSCGEVINILQYNLTRATDLVKSFKQVAVNQSHLVLEDVHLYELFDSLIRSLHHETKRKAVHYELDCPRNIILKTYAGALYQIFTNLIMNSLKHGFENMSAGECEIQIQAGYLTDGSIRITFADNGVGIKQEYKEKIFERFFTTKRGNGGSGLGMNIVQNLTHKQLHGKINLLPTTQGAGFEFILPAALKAK